MSFHVQDTQLNCGNFKFVPWGILIMFFSIHRIIESPKVPFLLFSFFFFFLGTCIGTWDLGLTIFIESKYYITMSDGVIMLAGYFHILIK